MSSIAPQSDTTYPANPHSLRNMSVSNRLFAQQGSPSVLLYAHIAEAACASTTVARNAGKYVSLKSRSYTFASKLCRSGSGPLCTAKCFGVATTFRYRGSFPCNPLTKETPNLEVRYGSSPYVSCPRPHLGSRKILMLGLQNVSPL